MSQQNRKLTKLEELLVRICANTEMKGQLRAAVVERRDYLHEQAKLAATNALFDPAQRDTAVGLLYVVQEYDDFLFVIDKS